jgi:hypothetical protein
MHNGRKKLLTWAQKIADDETAGHCDAAFDRLDLLRKLPQANKKVRWAACAHLTCDFT